MTPLRILVAEDDPHILQGLVDLLNNEGYQVTTAENGNRTLQLLDEQTFDLLLLDVMMPGKSGFDVCREVRRRGCALAIIMLTAKGEEIDKVVGLELGADDYVVKPFGVHELRARIHAVLRRSGTSRFQNPDSSVLPDVLHIGQAVVDRKRYSCQHCGQSYKLTAREMALLEIFFEHPDEVLSRDILLNQAWGIHYQGTTRTLDQHVAHLRKKIEPNPAVPSVIVTVHGVGYRYVSSA
ncbi:MAG: response regulator transcription factor [Syntrophotaleaceae bacterium]